jgi:hypothetical protein
MRHDLSRRIGSAATISHCKATFRKRRAVLFERYTLPTNSEPRIKLSEKLDSDPLF